MMPYSEDHIALAAEYALGTLDADERAQVVTMMSVDKDFTAMVEAWERKLGALNQMVGSVEPRPYVWDNIRTAVGFSGPQVALELRPIDSAHADGRPLIVADPPAYALHWWNGRELISHFDTATDHEVLASYDEGLKAMIANMLDERPV